MTHSNTLAAATSDQAQRRCLRAKANAKPNISNRPPGGSTSMVSRGFKTPNSFMRASFPQHYTCQSHGLCGVFF
jgi:hypothetical protein